MGCIARNVSFLGFFFAFHLIVMQYKYKNLWTVNGPRRREDDIPNIFRHLMHRLKIHVNVCCICFGSFYCCHWLFAAIHILFMLSECNSPWFFRLWWSTQRLVYCKLKLHANFSTFRWMQFNFDDAILKTSIILHHYFHSLSVIHLPHKMPWWQYDDGLRSSTMLWCIETCASAEVNSLRMNLLFSSRYVFT